MAGKAKYPSILKALTLPSGLEVKNRIALAPMTRARSGESRVPNDNNAEYYAQRANAGLVFTEASHISVQGIGWLDSAGIFTDEQAEGWKKVVKRVHDEGSIMYLQLWHQGRESHSSFTGGDIVSASDVTCAGDAHTADGKKVPHAAPKPLTKEEIKQTVQDYKTAAQRAKDAGFDGVEIHAANGYLPNQFLESKTNKRTDEYGGSIENRFRFLDEIFDAVAEVYPPASISVRVSPNGVFNDMGSPEYREQHLYVAEQLGKKGVGIYHVMDGLAFGFHELGEPMTLKEFRQVLPKTTVLMGNCGYDAETAEKRVAEGDADMIAIGRPFLGNPDYVTRLENDWPLADLPEMSYWYSPDYPDRKVYSTGEGYTSFPTYPEQQKAKA